MNSNLTPNPYFCRAAIPFVITALSFWGALQQTVSAIEPTQTVETSAGKLAFSTDGKLLAIGGSFGKQLKLWTVGSSEPPKVLETDDAVYQSVSFSPDGKLLSAARVSLDRSTPIVSVYESSGDKRLCEYTNGSFWSVFTPDSKGVVVGTVGAVSILDPRSGKRLSSFKVQNKANISAGGFSGDGKLFVTAGGEEKELKTWNFKSGKLLKTIPIAGDCETLAVSANGKLVAFAVEKTVSVISAETGNPVWSNGKTHTEKVRCVTISPNGKELASASDDRTVRRWNLSDGREIGSIESERGVCESVCYSPKDQLLAVGTPLVVMLYDLSK